MPDIKIVTSDMIQTPTTHDAMVGNELWKGVPNKTVYVNSSSELTNFASYPAGTVAIQYGFKGMWQLKPDGTWVSVI